MLPLIFGAIGAAVGGVSTIVQGEKSRRQIEAQRGLAEAAYIAQQGYSNNAYNLQRNESLASLARQKNRLAHAFGMEMQGINLGMERQAMQSQAALIAHGDSAGMALAQQGMSGAKGSGALQQRIDYHSSQLNSQLALQNRGDSLSMQNTAAQYSNQFNDIGREIDSWGRGGYRYQAQQLANEYGQAMHGFQMAGYDQAIRDAQPTALDYITSMVGGFASGASMGMQLEGLGQQMSSVKTAADAAATPDHGYDLYGGNALGLAPQPAAPSLWDQFGLGIAGISQFGTPLPAAAISGPAKNASGIYEASWDWAQSLGGDYAVDKNNYLYNRKTMNWQIDKYGLVKITSGPGAR